MITVHHLGISQSDRIVWLCEELDLPYELKRYDRDPATGLAPAEYRALTPFGTAPVIADDDLMLGESGAIVEYLIEVHGGGRLALHAGEPGFADYLFWFHFANGSLSPAVLVDMIAQMAGGDNPVLTALRSRVDRAYAQIEARLGETEYLAGEAFTAADLISVFPLTTMRLYAARDLAPFPNIRAWLQRIAARPAFQRAMAKADPGFEVPLG